jgi:multiple sugar transport system permease protein
MSDIERRSPGGRLILGTFLFVLLLASIIIIFPYFYSFTSGLKTPLEIYRMGLHLFPDQPNWGIFKALLTDPNARTFMIRMFKNSFIAAGGGVVGQLLISALAAYSLSRLNPKGKKVIQIIILISIAMPGIVTLVPFYILMTDLPLIHISAINHWWGLWIPYANSAFTILVLQHFFDQIPKEIFDAGRVDGASEVRMFFSFALPMTRSLLLVLGLLSFVRLWGDFLWPFLILRNASMQTISVVLYPMVTGGAPNVSMAIAFIIMIPPTLAAVILQPYIKGGLTF